MGCATGIVKLLVFIFNFACSIVGIALIAIGSLFFVSISKIDEIADGNFSVAPKIVLAVGVIVFIISFLGCCGVCRQSSCMLTTYAVILLLLLIVQLVAGIYGFVQIKDNEEFRSDFKMNIRKSLAGYNKNDGIKDAWDTFQQTLDCCGVDSPGDWVNEGLPVPKSCCVSDASGCDVTSAYQTGCYTKLYDTVTDGVQIVSYVALGIAAVEFLGAVFAIFLVKSMKKASRMGFA